jgi:hypothetical protein
VSPSIASRSAARLPKVSLPRIPTAISRIDARGTWRSCGATDPPSTRRPAACAFARPTAPAWSCLGPAWPERNNVRPWPSTASAMTWSKQFEDLVTPDEDWAEDRSATAHARSLRMAVQIASVDRPTTPPPRRYHRGNDRREHGRPRPPRDPGHRRHQPQARARCPAVRRDRGSGHRQPRPGAGRRGGCRAQDPPVVRLYEAMLADRRSTRSTSRSPTPCTIHGP